ncbi:MAG: substrate-binding domain-containing protein [Candidatus Binataceae bacterium]
MADEPNRLRRARLARGLSQIELAQRAGISRQALSAIEAGAYQPGVSVALKLAHELGQSVEQLFGEQGGLRLSADCISLGPRTVLTQGARVSLARVGGRLVAVPLPVTCLSLMPAAGLTDRVQPGRRVEVSAFRSAGEIESTLLMVGCDPAVAILRDYLVRRQSSVDLIGIPSSSRNALEMTAGGGAHVAGVHLRDPKTGEYNFAAARETFGRKHFKVINFARWELGLATRMEGARVHDVGDLRRRGVRLVNREPGAGARLALDEALASHGIRPHEISGYEKLVCGHLEVAAAIAEGVADAGVTIRLAANLYSLKFQPWREERYDLVVPTTEFESAPVQSLMEALNSRALAREIASLCAYDTNQMGQMVTQAARR